MAQLALAARIRKDRGKEAARKLRKEGQIPAVCYGPKSAPVALAVDYLDLERTIKQASSENIILDLMVESEKGTQPRRAMLKDLQIEPIKGSYLHADFYEIAMDEEITVDIPIHLTGESIGVEKGGILSQIRRQLSVTCLPGKLVDSLEVDVSGLDIGDSLHIEDLTLPEGMESNEEGHLTVATISAPSEVAEEEEEEVEEEVEEEDSEI